MNTTIKVGDTVTVGKGKCPAVVIKVYLTSTNLNYTVCYIGSGYVASYWISDSSPTIVNSHVPNTSKPLAGRQESKSLSWFYRGQEVLLLWKDDKWATVQSKKYLNKPVTVAVDGLFNELKMVGCFTSERYSSRWCLVDGLDISSGTRVLLDGSLFTCQKVLTATRLYPKFTGEIITSTKKV